MTPGLLSAPYPEGAAMQLSRHPGLLQRAFVGSAYSARGPSMQSPVELVRIPQYDAQRLLRAARLHRPAAWTMYKAHAQHDISVSKLVDRVDATFCIALPGSAEATWHRLPETTLRVLHVVNAHPAHHNEVLACASKDRIKTQEFVPSSVVSRVQRELEAADLLLVPSQLMVQQLASRGVSRSRIALIPYGVDPELFTPRARTFTANQTQFLFVGQISRRKGLQYLLESMRALPSATLQLVGPVVDGSLLRGLPANVRFTGSLNRQALSSVMRTVKALVLPSLEDSFGLVALEAAASGTPVVISSACGASELLDEYPPLARFRVPPGDVAALTAALRHLVDIPEREWHALSAGATAVARAHTWDRYRLSVAQAIRGVTA